MISQPPFKTQAISSGWSCWEFTPTNMPIVSIEPCFFSSTKTSSFDPLKNNTFLWWRRSPVETSRRCSRVSTRSLSSSRGNSKHLNSKMNLLRRSKRAILSQNYPYPSSKGKPSECTVRLLSSSSSPYSSSLIRNFSSGLTLPSKSSRKSSS